MPYPVAAARGRQPVASSANGLLTGLTCYWALNEASGNAVNLINSQAWLAANAPGSNTGKVYALAREFVRAATPSTPVLYAASDAAVEGITGPFTIAWWEMPYGYTDVGGEYNIILDNSLWNNHRGVRCMHTHTGGWVFYLNSEGHAGAEHTDIVPTLNVWTLGIWTYNPTTGAVAVSANLGTPYAYTWADGPVVACTGAYEWNMIGGQYYEGECKNGFNGRLGPLMVWSRVLTATQQAALYNAGAGLAYDKFTA